MYEEETHLVPTLIKHSLRVLISTKASSPKKNVISNHFIIYTNLKLRRLKCYDEKELCSFIKRKKGIIH